MSMKLLLETWKAHTQELLTEKKMEQVEIRFQSESFLKAVKEFNEEETESMTRFGFGGASQPKSPQDIQERLTNKIPRDIKEKDKAEALDWMITSFIKTKDTYFFSKDIELFYQIKQKGQDRLLAKNSIYTIKDSIELHEIVEEAKPGWDAYNQAKANEKAKKDVEKGTNQIYENDDWKVFVPENKGASCDLAKGSEWCTGAIGLPYYEQYHKPDDPLIIFISRKETFKKKVKEYNKETKTWELVEKIFPVKYQFHYGSKQFMDKDDRNIDQTTTWFELNSIVANMPNPRISDDIKEQAAENSEGFEKLPNGGYKITNGYNIYYYDKNQNLHREDGPAFIDFDYDKNPLHEHWYIHGKKGRIDDGPAETEYYPNGKPKRQKWFTSGSLGREDDKPTIISYDESGKITQEEWLDTDGIRNRKNGPALIRADGTKVWYYNGEKHRFDGPAWESPDEIAYFWMGNRVSKEEYEERLYAYENIPFEESLQRIIKEELVNVLQEEWSAKYKRSIDCKNPKGFSQRAHCQGRKKNEGNDPKVGTGKKPEGSGRRLYTDEDPSDTVSVKFSTVQDIKDTLSKESFKSKSHARQSQIINLIHQRVRAAYQNAKDPEVKARLKKAYEYAEQRKEASKEKTARLQKEEQSIQLNEKCWKGYTQKGMKTMFGKEYPNCVKKTDEEMELEEKRKLGKPSSETNLGDWFKRKGAPGKKGGWVDCNTCRDGKCKPCGRQSGEKRSKYPRCRPTPSQCKGYKRRGSNLQKEE